MDSSSNGPMSVRTGRELYKSLETPEAVTLYTCITVAMPVSLPNQPATAVDVKETDDDFWRVFDFAFIDGKPYDRATFDAGIPVAVITESVARMLFGTTQATGREFLLAHAPYRVSGVVRDVSTLAESAYAQVWIPFTSTDQVDNTWNKDLMGMMSCTISPPSVKNVTVAWRPTTSRWPRTAGSSSAVTVLTTRRSTSLPRLPTGNLT